MQSILPDNPDAAPHRGRLNRAIKESLRDLGAQLSLLNHRRRKAHRKLTEVR